LLGGKWAPALILLALALVCTLPAACGGGGSEATASPEAKPTQSAPTPEASPTQGAATVDMRNTAFHPQTLVVSRGATVTWTNSDSVSHTVTGDNIEMESGTMGKGDTFSFTFTEAGEFDYHCSIHPFMKGRVVVQ